MKRSNVAALYRYTSVWCTSSAPNQKPTICRANPPSRPPNAFLRHSRDVIVPDGRTEEAKGSQIAFTSIRLMKISYFLLVPPPMLLRDCSCLVRTRSVEVGAPRLKAPALADKLTCLPRQRVKVRELTCTCACGTPPTTAVLSRLGVSVHATDSTQHHTQWG